MSSPSHVLLSTRRESCRLCLSGNLEIAYEIGPVSLSDVFSETRDKALAVPRVPVDVYLCSKCAHVQQLDVVNPNLLWGNFLYLTSSSRPMVTHLRKTALALLSSLRLGSKDLVVDIGSNDGTFLRHFAEAGLRVQGVDPAEKIAHLAGESGIPTIPQGLSLEVATAIRAQHGPAKLITAFNVFGHIDNLHQLMDCIELMLEDDGFFVFECQYLSDILDKRLVATFFHEHLSHHGIYPLRQFFEQFDLSLIDAFRVDAQHGSIVGIVKRTKDAVTHQRLEILASKEMVAPKSLLKEFRALGEATKRSSRIIRQYLNSILVSGQVLVAYGAARSLPTLAKQFGLEGLHKYAVDGHPQKIGKYESSEGLLVKDLNSISSQQVGAATIFAWVHEEEIRNSNLPYIEAGGSLVSLCPNATIINNIGSYPV